MEEGEQFKAGWGQTIVQSLLQKVIFGDSGKNVHKIKYQFSSPVQFYSIFLLAVKYFVTDCTFCWVTSAPRNSVIAPKWCLKNPSRKSWISEGFFITNLEKINFEKYFFPVLTILFTLFLLCTSSYSEWF